MTLSIALRGDTARFPGNTLPALRSALRAGADLVKIDIHMTADGYPVLVDEHLVAAPSSPTRPVDELSLAELASTRDNIEHRVPTLMEVLAELHGHHTCALLLEARAPEAALAAEALLRERGCPDRALFTGSSETLGALRDGSPQSQLMLAWEQPTPPPEDVTRSLRPTFVGTHHTQLTRDAVNEMHRNGFRVAAWTVNEFSDMARLMGMGVDAVATDRIEHLVSLTAGGTREQSTAAAGPH